MEAQLEQMDINLDDSDEEEVKANVNSNQKKANPFAK